MYSSLPKYPIILLSFVNTELRDKFSSFQEFCKAHSISESEINDKLNDIGYFYNEKTNSFK